jgi:hypothetical protein
MPPLIFVQPSSARFPMTPDKYAALVISLKLNKDASNLVVTELAGTVTYQKIDFSWYYDDEPQELIVTIVGDRNWKAKIAGKEAVFEELNDQLISKV